MGHPLGFGCGHRAGPAQRGEGARVRGRVCPGPAALPVQLSLPDLIYDGSCDLDLGGRVVQLRPTGQGHTKGDQVVMVPDAGVMFTGDLVEAGQFFIFPWFPPYDTDVSGVGWIAVMQRLIGERPRVVVPGHGDIGGPELLAEVRDYLAELRDETWRRRDSAMSEQTIANEVRALLIERHPGWAGQDWIGPAAGCLYHESAGERDGQPGRDIPG